MAIRLRDFVIDYNVFLYGANSLTPEQYAVAAAGADEPPSTAASLFSSDSLANIFFRWVAWGSGRARSVAAQGFGASGSTALNPRI